MNSISKNVLMRGFRGGGIFSFPEEQQLSSNNENCKLSTLLRRDALRHKQF